MPLCLVVPGLLWPRKAHADTTYDLQLPALARLCGRGRLTIRQPLSLEAQLCLRFGIDGDEIPAAALRLLGTGTHPGVDAWLCADLAHIGVEQNNIALTETPPTELAPEESAALAAPLAELFAEVGELQLDAAGRGHLRLRRDAALTTTPPSAAIARRADTVEPQGDDARTWRRLANEAQMLLHGQVLNRARESSGRKAINSLWFWGNGRLPLQRPCPDAAAWGGRVSSSLLQGLAAWGEIPFRPAPGSAADWLAEPQRDGLLVVESLLPATQALDALAWRHALQAMEAEWFAPLAEALAGGRLDRLTLIALGDEATVDVDASPGDRFRFWRRPQPLAALLPSMAP